MNDLQIIIDEDQLLQAIRQQPEKLTRELDRALDRVLFTFSRDARAEAPKAFSILANSIGVDRQGPLEGTVGPSVVYGRAVEEGTDPGTLPPVDAIEDWIRVRHIQPNDPSMDERDLAWAIAKSIAEGGTPAQPYMRPAFEHNRARAESLINDAINRSLQ